MKINVPIEDLNPRITDSTTVRPDLAGPDQLPPPKNFGVPTRQSASARPATKSKGR